MGEDREQKPRRNHSAVLEAKAAIEALAVCNTIAEIAQHDVHPSQITEWRRQLTERAAGVIHGFSGSVPVLMLLCLAPAGTMTAEPAWMAV